MGAYAHYALQPTPQQPMLVTSEGQTTPDDVHGEERWQARSRCPSCVNTLISNVYHRASHQAHFAIAKALFTPIVAMICIILGQLLQRKGSIAKEEYRASFLTSLLAGFIGGQCLVGSVILLNILFDTRPSPGNLWHRHFTFTAMFIMFIAGGASGPLGAKIINVNNDPNSAMLDPRHAFFSSALGAGLLFWVLIIVKAVLLSELIFPSFPISPTVALYEPHQHRSSKARYP
jgi:hypothetical protein